MKAPHDIERKLLTEDPDPLTVSSTHERPFHTGLSVTKDSHNLTVVSFVQKQTRESRSEAAVHRPRRRYRSSYPYSSRLAAIANRIKAKGLQKLRWYCQMCQKQCRDENGFKCHCMSEGHQRQMEVFGQNPNRIVDGYSEEFDTSFLDHMKRSHRFSRIAATVV
ncbi:hypothetical protein RHMOL_Rhmol05G0217600 [Rhododendron molle]|uniref:Uncharacterized protein n=1 Tax=Rhododendron molle TaxID=49168 RepID=A0ACC0NT54_RHOML|nr:hypothetical protein RHMOL_Rhmol05G0217600 [Rhododendron molle]